jgi:hypothetical protein
MDNDDIYEIMTSTIQRMNAPTPIGRGLWDICRLVLVEASAWVLVNVLAGDFDRKSVLLFALLECVAAMNIAIVTKMQLGVTAQKLRHLAAYSVVTHLALYSGLYISLRLVNGQYPTAAQILRLCPLLIFGLILFFVVIAGSSVVVALLLRNFNKRYRLPPGRQDKGRGP